MPALPRDNTFSLILTALAGIWLETEANEAEFTSVVAA